MKTFYCERFDREQPYFPHYKGEFISDAAALEFFRQTHGQQLQCVYDEDFRIIFEA